MTIQIRSHFILLLLGIVAACSPQPDSPNPYMLASGMAPHLAVSPDGVAILSYIAPTQSGHALRYVQSQGGQWSEVRTVTQGDNWFVNWADFPSVEPVTDTLWAAHWLVRRPAGGYAYDVYAAVSQNAGQSWTDPFLLHNDGTDSEHGFVTLFRARHGFGAVWLDGRNTVAADDLSDAHAPRGMTLRAAQFDASGKVSHEQVVDELTCDCCQTDVAMTDEGPVLVYRDRSADEVRDIYISRLVDGVWQPGQAVHDDGWVISGCPVNGPVVKANGKTVAVTWFTSANDTAAVKMAWSQDAGRTFAAPVVLADEGVVGYVGEALVDQNTAVASWLCKGASRHNAICYRRVQDNGTQGPVHRLETQSVVSRMSVPQLARVDDQLMFVWTEKMDDRFQISSAMIPL